MDNSFKDALITHQAGGARVLFDLVKKGIIVTNLLDLVILTILGIILLFIEALTDYSASRLI